MKPDDAYSGARGISDERSAEIGEDRPHFGLRLPDRDIWPKPAKDPQRRRASDGVLHLEPICRKRHIEVAAGRRAVVNPGGRRYDPNDLESVWAGEPRSSVS